MKSLLESGVHFGHQTRRWDPRMSKYIFAERNGIHIIDLQKTMVEIKAAYEVLRKTVLDGKSVLFVGTKKQARTAIKTEAEKCNQFYVNHRWLGGMLTNFTTIKKSIVRLKKIEKMEIDGTFDSIVKKEKLKLLKEKIKLEENLGGIKEMNNLPGIVFIVDSKKEAIAVSEARKLNIPIVAVVDTNCNPNDIDYPIPGNDDAIRAIELFCSIVSSACIDATNEAGTTIFEDDEVTNLDLKTNENNNEEDSATESQQNEKEDDNVEIDETAKHKKSKEKKEEPKKDEPIKEKPKKDEGGKKNMAVSMADVKKLRDLTNAGMLDCKNALIESNGNIDDALKYLKEKGLADAKKRSDKETKEGGVFIKEKDDKIAMVLIGCETDFVANNEIFLETKDKILDKILESGKDDIKNYEKDIQDAMAQIKENMEIKDAKFITINDNQCASTYIHGKNKIGVIAVFECKDSNIKDNEKFKEFSNNICLHITANSPYYLKQEDVPESEIAEQKNIAMKQMENEKKPADVLEKIINGKISKHLSEICLLSQKYVKDDKITVQKYIDSVSKELDNEIKIVNFVRYIIGN